jgi:tetratricopeptide (TPR) repeat protein
MIFSPRKFVLAAGLLLFASLPEARLIQAQAETGSVEGLVQDAQRLPLTGVQVFLDDQIEGRGVSATTDTAGHFLFAGVAPGSYLLHAKKAGYLDSTNGPFLVEAKQTVTRNLQMAGEKNAPAEEDAAQTLEYSDEPKFSVSAVTDPSNLGGHSSNVTLPTKQALAKDTAALATENSSAGKAAAAKEGEGRSIEAVKEYQRAAEVDPSEENLFAWGAELLLHRADAPAAEVFAKGHRMYPRSVRLLVGMGAAAYAQDLNDQAARRLLEASELDPSDPRPYLFLGKVQEVAKSEPKEWVAAFERYAKLRPKDARAHYFYATALEKRRLGRPDFAAREAELKKALALDPRCGDAYLRLGLLDAERGELAKAVESLQRAVQFTPLPDEAHLRLAQVYRQMGETEKAKKESELSNEVSAKKKEQLDHERRELGQFIFTMGENSPKP